MITITNPVTTINVMCSNFKTNVGLPTQLQGKDKSARIPGLGTHHHLGSLGPPQAAPSSSLQLGAEITIKWKETHVRHKD